MSTFKAASCFTADKWKIEIG